MKAKLHMGVGQCEAREPLHSQNGEKFKEDKRVVLRDNILQKGIIVDIVEGIPFCNQCRSNDCAHVGFAICAEQMKET